MAETAAVFYALMAGVAATFQLCLAWGAPWGRMTLGGQFPGRLPGPVRVGAFVQSGVLVAMALVVLGRAGVLEWSPPAWAFWTTVALTALTAGGALRTPAIEERRLWGPVAAAMVAALAVITFAGDPR